MQNEDIQGVFCADWQPISSATTATTATTNVGTLVVAVTLNDIPVQLNWLDEQERERGRRLRTVELQQRYFSAHTALRQILGWRLNCLPSALIFGHGEHGKPHLIHHRLAFNLSHSGSYALIAMAEHGSVGIDLERRDPLRELDLMADRVFASSELSVFRALPVAQREHAFFVAWTRKEAALKALGLGLPGGMEHIVFQENSPMLDGNFAALPRLRSLQIVDLPTVPEFAAALCHGPHPGPVGCRRWLNHYTSPSSDPVLGINDSE